MKHPVIAMKIHHGDIKINTFPEPMETKLGLPDGCLGILFAFESKKKAREYWGKDINMIRLDYDLEDQ